MCSVVSDSFDPMDCIPSGSSVHEILQARILEWIALPLSRGSSQPRDRTLSFSALQEDSLRLRPGKPNYMGYKNIKYFVGGKIV